MPDVKTRILFYFFILIAIIALIPIASILVNIIFSLGQYIGTFSRSLIENKIC